MGVFKKFFNEFTDDDDVKDYPEDEEEINEDDESSAPASSQDKLKNPQQSVRQNTMTMSSNTLEMKVVKPEKFEEVTAIADFLVRRHTVVLNLEDTNRETVLRIIDFLSGVVFAIKGSLKRVANSTYIVTPSGVSVSGEQSADSDAPKELF